MAPMGFCQLQIKRRNGRSAKYVGVGTTKALDATELA